VRVDKITNPRDGNPALLIQGWLVGKLHIIHFHSKRVHCSACHGPDVYMGLILTWVKFGSNFFFFFWQPQEYVDAVLLTDVEWVGHCR
jgi:hypothetical protein